MPRRHLCFAPLPAPLGLRFRALLGLGFVPPPEPRPCAPSPTRCSRLPASLYVAIEQIQNRRLGRCHREVPCVSSPPRPPPASRPPCADIRVTPPISLLALRRPQGPGWQEPRRMHPFFAECAKKAPFLATSARNACFSRSEWQHPRPMHPFPGAIGRFRIHGARILPPRALFRVEEPEITHGAKMLPAPPGLSAAAACDTRHGRTGFAPCGAGLACLPHAPPPCHLACARRGLRPLPSRPRSSPPSYMRRASPPASRPPCPAICHAAHCGRGEPPIGLFLLPSCCPRRRIAPTDARSPAPPGPQPAPTGPRPRANRVPTTRGAVCAHPRPATRRASPCRVGLAAVPVIPAKWCGDTIAHTRKLRF